MQLTVADSARTGGLAHQGSVDVKVTQLSSRGVLDHQEVLPCQNRGWAVWEKRYKAMAKVFNSGIQIFLKDISN